MSARRKAVTKFRRAARQRLATGKFLVENEFNLDGIYIAGYAVECALKALILQRTPDARFDEIYNLISSGKKAHDFEFLKNTFRTKPVSGVIPQELRDHFLEVRDWTTDWRYTTFAVVDQVAQAFIESTQQIFDWMERNL
jgi:hypothetical protein